MIIAKVHVSGAQAGAVDKKPITAGMVGAQVQLIYTDSVWKGLKKTLVFYGAVTRYIVTDAEVVTIPAAVLAKPNIQLVVGVYGENATGSLVIPTLRAELGMIRVGTMVSGNKEEYVLDTSDATAAAEDIANGKTAYVNGEKVTGNVVTIKEGEHVTFAAVDSSVSEADSSSVFLCSGKDTTRDKLLRKGSYADVYVFRKEFGDAAAEDVAAGKTFTSAAGLKVTGTNACPEGLDTTDATATAEDMAEGKTAYVNGQKVNGTLPDGTYLSTNTADSIRFEDAGSRFGPLEKYQLAYITHPFSERRIVGEDCSMSIVAPASSLGNAKASDVAKGKTFTSTAGLKVTGTHECSGGLDTSDATATAEDMAEGVTAYVNGQKITGTVPEKVELVKYDAVAGEILVISSGSDGSHDTSRNGKYIEISATLDDGDGKAIVSPGTELSQRLRPAEFGDADASDVVAGKTFTSAAGLKVTGTHECTGGIDTSDATATAGDILAGKSAYVNGSKVTGTIHSKGAADLTASGASVSVPAGYYASAASKAVSTAEQAVPTISVSSNGKITATAEQSAGYVESGTKSVTHQLTTQAAQTITPGTADKTIASGKYLTGIQTVKGDANLVSGNIKSGVSIFGVSGSYEGSGELDTSDATAAAEDMAEGKTAYVNGEKVTGTLPVSNTATYYTTYTSVEHVVSGSSAWFACKGTGKEKQIVTNATVNIEPGKFGNASAEDVVAGKTFTSYAGLKVTGTHECAAGLDTSDATATASDILSGKTAYVNGQKVTGSIASQSAQTITPGTTDKTISSGKYLSGTQTIKGDSNLLASNIKSGVSIFGVAGSYEGSGGSGNNNCEAYQITSTSGTVSPKGSGTVKVWGYGYKSGSYTGTTYAFVGDGYYSGGYGTPSKTSATFSVNSDGTVSGLPSGLTALNVLVTIGI